MITQRLPLGFAVLSMILVGALLAGCASTTPTTGPFTQVNRIETELQWGVSTKMDVERVLGKPNGSGSALTPIDSRPREIWLYEDVEATSIQVEPGRSGMRPSLRMDMRQQILMIFFDRGVFDGFMWFSNAPAAAAATK